MAEAALAPTPAPRAYHQDTIDWYLSRYPHRAAELREELAAGRIRIVDEQQNNNKGGQNGTAAKIN